MNASVIRLFQQAVYAWVFGYALLLLLLGEPAWCNALVDAFPAHSPFASLVPVIMRAITPPVGSAMCCLLMIGAAILLRKHSWYMALLVWLVFRLITHRTWLASNGGIQLMENMLFWAALLSIGPGREVSPLGLAAFWIARLQLLLVYAAAAAHKYTGTTWPDGSAVSIVAADPAFHLRWLQRLPVICNAATYAALAFMTLFPVAVWWHPSRRVILFVGLCFHLFTALFMGIPQMAFAFIACYTLWLTENEVAAMRTCVGSWIERARGRVLPRATGR